MYIVFFNVISITTGIDIVDVKRFRKIPLKKMNDFYKKNFNLNEIKYCNKFKDPYPHFAGKFALKESFLKAIRKPVPFKKINTKHGKLGEPIITCSAIKCKKIEASISHDKNFAIANVIIIW